MSGSCLGKWCETLDLVAFLPRPQIPSDLGRNVTHNSNLHQKCKRFLSENGILAYPQPAAIWDSQAQPAPCICGGLKFPKSQTRKPQSQNWGARRPQIAESPATRPIGP